MSPALGTCMIRRHFTQIDLYFCCIRRYCTIAPCSIIKHMIPSDITARVAQLRGELQLHNYLYYVMQSPSISDSDFDELFRELQDLESQYPNVNDIDNKYAEVLEHMTNVSVGKCAHLINY